MKTRIMGVATCVALVCGALPGVAGTFTYEAIIESLSPNGGPASSGLGGSARADIVFDQNMQTLYVNIQGGGFAPDMLHVQHIHGRFNDDGSPRDSVSPTLADDADGDGVIELLEGAPSYGGILLSLFDEENVGNGFNGFPSAPNGIIDFEETYDLSSTTAFSDGITAEDLFPLDKREIVIHGAFLGDGIGGVGNEMNPMAGYSNFVPVAAGEIVETTTPIPLPAAGWLLIAGMGGLAALKRRASGA